MGRKDPTHDPEARPLGCNGKYGQSGARRHKRHGTEICDLCRASAAHFGRAVRRGDHVPRAQSNWDLTHNPERRPVGCNGRYGKSGADKHRYNGEKVCAKCRASQNHIAREYKRGGIRPKPLKPCGTNAAAERHRAKGEPLCFDCKVAIARRGQEYRDRKKQEPMDVHQ